MKKMDSVSNSLICGIGQIGTALASILKCDGIDLNQTAPQKSYKFLHICFPYSETFVEDVKAYQIQYSPEYTIVHSTVAVGTCDKIENVFYSPCRGVHPDLEKGLRVFEKNVAGEMRGAMDVVCYLTKFGIPASYRFNSTNRDLEAAKLWDTTIYGINILLEKEIYQYCQKNGLDFDVVYTMFNESYNEGYEKLGHPEYKKYVLKHMEGPIGGHCIKSNACLLDTPMAELLCKNTKS